MEKNKNKQSIAEGLISYILPQGMSDWFEIVNYYEEPNPDTSFLDTLYDKVLHVHLDERLSPDAEKLGLKPNGFTETKLVKDYPLRNRKVLLHLRRRRYLDKNNRNVVLQNYKIAADGTKMSVEYGLFF